MVGRPRTPISTGGTIRTRKVNPGVFRAITIFRDWDGQNRKVVASGVSRNAAEAALKADLTARLRSGGVGDSLNASSPFVLLAQAWMEDVAQNVDRSQGTRDMCQRELRSLILPFLDNFTIREVTVGRVELSLEQQRGKSYARAKHSRVMLGMVMAFAVRGEIVDRNPVKEASRMKQPPHTPKALTMEQIAAICLAATRIGEALALRHCDVDITADPPRVTISGTIVVHIGAGVHRQEHPKTHESNRVISIPRFAADVIRERLALLDVEDTEHLLFFTRVGTPLTPSTFGEPLGHSAQRWPGRSGDLTTLLPPDGGYARRQRAGNVSSRRHARPHLHVDDEGPLRRIRPYREVGPGRGYAKGGTSEVRCPLSGVKASSPG
jgi:hypothetical protein